MRFGRIELAEAEGAILAHTLRLPGFVFRKGRVLTRADVAALAAAGCDAVAGALLATDEIGEDAAAARLARALRGTGILARAPYTGRCNLYAEADGVLHYAREWLDRVNLLDEAVTVAALQPYARVRARQRVATIKIIPYGVAGATIDAAEAIAAAAPTRLAVAPFVPRATGLLQTELPGLRPALLERTRAVTEGRLAALGSRIAAERRCAHATEDIARMLGELRAAGCDLLLVSGASATADRRDVVPEGIVAAGGEILHLGMPVEPGNLLVLGRIGGAPVLCLPGCARSPAANGIDRVLERLAAGLAVTSADIMRMGAGGLLDRAGRDGDEPAVPETAQRIAAIVLAAGRSTRMGALNKLLAPVAGEPLVRHTVRAVLASQARPVTVVLGHAADEVRTALAGLDVTCVDNPDHAQGMSTSLRTGLAALPPDVDAALVCLGDMPWVSAAAVDRLIAAYSPADGRHVCVPTHAGTRGNPVLWARRHFDELQGVSGDAGARTILARLGDAVCEVPVEDDGVLRDVDVPEALPRSS